MQGEIVRHEFQVLEVGRFQIGKPLLNIDELLFRFEKRIHDVRIEMDAALFENDRLRDVVREGVFVNSFRSEASYTSAKATMRPQSGNLVADQTLGIAAAVVPFVMRERDVVRHPQEFRVRLKAAAAASVSAPIRTCDFMISNSLSVSGPPFSSTLS